jgi:acyl carrier protein
MTDEDVWEKLQKIVADILGVKVEKVTPSARFVEDLGAG